MSSGLGSDMKFLFWDDPGDSQEHVDKQANTSPCANHALQQDEEEKDAQERMIIILRNGNSGEHYPEYKDYMDDTDEQEL